MLPHFIEIPFAFAKPFVVSHWEAIMFVLGAWSVAATKLARKWPKLPPTAPWWKRAAHFFLVDGPSALPLLNGRSWFGMRISIPYVTWTTQSVAVPPDRDSQDPPADRNVAVVLPFLFVASVFLSNGCAPGTDGVRQSVGNTKAMLTQATLGGITAYQVGQNDIRVKLIQNGKGWADTAEQMSATYKRQLNLFLDAMDAAQKRLNVVTEACDLYDKTKKGDLKNLQAEISKITIDISVAVESFRKVLNELMSKSDVGHLVSDRAPTHRLFIADLSFSMQGVL